MQDMPRRRNFLRRQFKGSWTYSSHFNSSKKTSSPTTTWKRSKSRTVSTPSTGSWDATSSPSKLINAWFFGAKTVYVSSGLSRTVSSCVNFNAAHKKSNSLSSGLHVMSVIVVPQLFVGSGCGARTGAGTGARVGDLVGDFVGDGWDPPRLGRMTLLTVWLRREGTTRWEGAKAQKSAMRT